MNKKLTSNMIFLFKKIFVSVALSIIIMIHCHWRRKLQFCEQMEHIIFKYKFSKCNKTAKVGNFDKKEDNHFSNLVPKTLLMCVASESFTQENIVMLLIMIDLQRTN